MMGPLPVKSCAHYMRRSGGAVATHEELTEEDTNDDDDEIFLGHAGPLSNEPSILALSSSLLSSSLSAEIPFSFLKTTNETTNCSSSTPCFH